MSIGVPELLVILVVGTLLLVTPIVMVSMAVLLTRRIRDLEARIEKLESRRDAP